MSYSTGFVPSEKRIAIVEDDGDLARVMRDALDAEGYQVTLFADGRPFMHYVRDNGLPHLAVIDIGLPSDDGFKLSEQLKGLGDVPIIFISTRREVETVVKGLSLYGEDYLRKPFHMRELGARVRRVLMRFPGFDYAESHIITVDDWLSIDFRASRIYAGERSLALTPREAGLLYVLACNMGDPVPSETLINRIWPQEEVFEDTLRVHIYRLRHKLEPDPNHPYYIQTIRGAGYCFGVTNPALAHHLAALAPTRHE